MWDNTGHTHTESDITDLGAYPDATGQASGKVAETDGADGWTFIDTPTGGGGGGASTLETWSQDNAAASQTDVTLTLLDDIRETVRMLSDGELTAVLVESKEARTGGTLTVTVQLNGLDTALTATLDGTNTEWHKGTGTVTVSAGDEVGVVVTTDGTWAPTTAEITARVQVGSTDTAGTGSAPDTVTGISAWFDPDDLDATLADRDSVSSWQDSTGSVTVSQGTAAAQPMFLTSAIAGHDIVRFDAADDLLQAGNTTDLDVGTGDFTIVAVVNLSALKSDTSQNTILSKDYTRYELHQAGVGFRLFVGGTSDSLVLSTEPSTGRWTIIVVRRSGTTIEGFIGKRFEGSVTNSAGNTGGSAFTLGQRPGGASSLLLDGFLGDVAIWASTAISQADWHSVVDYFGNKYGVTV